MRRMEVDDRTGKSQLQLSTLIYLYFPRIRPVKKSTHPVVGVHDDVHLENLPAFQSLEDIPADGGGAVNVAAFVGVLHKQRENVCL